MPSQTAETVAALRRSSMGILVLPAVYLIAFLPPLAARSWRSLGLVAFGGSIGSIGLFVLASLGGGLFLFAMSFALIAAFAGFAAGCATKAALLAVGGDRHRLRQAGIVVLGLASVPAMWSAAAFHRVLASRAAYAELPQAASFAARPGCEPFRASGPLLDTLVVARQRKADLLAPDESAIGIHMRYPIAYQEIRPEFPVPMAHEAQIGFQMHVSDGSIVKPDEETDAQGRWISYQRREPAVLFTVHDRDPVAQAAATALRVSLTRAGNPEMPELRLSASSIGNLQAVDNAALPYVLYRHQFVEMRDGEIIQLVRCGEAGRLPNPSCEFMHDRGSIKIDGRFGLASLPDWPIIKSRIEQFIECAHVESAPADG